MDGTSAHTKKEDYVEVLEQQQQMITYAPEMLMQLAEQQRGTGVMETPQVYMNNPPPWPVAPEEHVDLSSIQLNPSMFVVVRFGKTTDLSLSRFNESDFYRCDFTHTNAAMIKASACTFCRCTGEQVNFASGVFRGSLFEHCHFMGAHCSSGVFDMATFTDSSFQGADFKSATFIGARFERCNLNTTNWNTNDCSGASFAGCDLSAAYFFYADFVGVDFRGTNLDNTTFDSVQLGGTLFSSVEQLRRAELSHIYQAVKVCCQQRPKAMELVRDFILHEQMIVEWTKRNCSEDDAPAAWDTLGKWLGNYDLCYPMQQNPPIEILIDWIDEFLPPGPFVFGAS